MAEQNTTSNKTNNPYLVPGAILISGLLIAGAVIYGNYSNQQTANQNASQNEPSGETNEAPDKPTTDKVAEVTEDDHVRGSMDAPIKIVEYSDFECPFCQRFHDTLNQVMDKYGESGEVAWVFRQLPLEQLHPKNAMEVANVSECVAEIGGNEAFWQFADGYFEKSPANDQTDLDVVLPELYNEIGIDQSEVEACVESGRHQENVQEDMQNAIETGARGTPWTIIIGPDGETYPVNGAQPFRSVDSTIQQILNN